MSMPTSLCSTLAFLMMIVVSGTNGRRLTKRSPISKFFFVAAHREWRFLIQNYSGAPYGTAHNATANPDDGYLQKETVDAITDLATTTTSDRSVIAQLMDTVARLMTDLATVNAKIVFTLQTNRASQGGREGHDRTTCRQGSRAGSGACTGTGAVTPTRTSAIAPTMAD